MMFGRARQWGERPMLHNHHAGEWHKLTWAEFARQAAGLARALRAAGVAAGDRVVVASENRPEVAIAETALMALRAAPAPVYTTSTASDWAHVLRDSGARAAIVSTPALSARMQEAAGMANGLDLLVTMDEAEFQGWLADPAPPDDIEAEAEHIAPGGMACLLYTSGTSGPPRGVMLPHRAILSNCRGAHSVILAAGLSGGRYLSFLPLSHSYEHTVGQFLLPSMGFEVWYSRGIEHLAADLLAVQPVIITMVPRMLEVLRTRILGGLARQKPWQQRLFQQALQSGLRRLDGKRSLADLMTGPILDRLVRRKVQARFGGRLAVAVSGSARLEPDTGRFFLALGIPILQGYGQTEAGPVISVNDPARINVETVGPPLQGVDLRIAEDGEILVRGDLVMDGYWNQPEATAAALEGGWLHTGDVGALDEAGRLRITGRKKEIIVLSGGEKVWPARVESLLSAEPEISQAVVAGDGQVGLSALIVPADNAEAKAVGQAISRVNKTLSAAERVRKHATVPAFTVENGLLTPSMKVRRPLVIQTHAALLAELRG